jgi:hypothetical protein
MDEFNQDDPPLTPEDKRGWRDLTLKGAGYGLVIGDVAMAVAALNPGGAARDYNKFATSLLYSVGGITVAKYGNPKLDTQLELLEAKLAQHLKDNHIEIPKGSALDKASLAQSGALKQTEQFLYTYPSEVMNGVLGLGGAFAVMSGKQQGNLFSKAYGWIVMAAALSGILIRELPKDVEKPEGTGKRALHWLREKPLRISGGLYMVNNATLAMSALNERKLNPGSKNYLWTLGCAGCYAGANGLLAMSSKQQQGTDHAQNTIVQEIGKAGAQIVSALPKAMQDSVIIDISEYMSGQRLVSDDASVFAKSMRNYIADMNKESSPKQWQDRVVMSKINPTTEKKG